jgi:Clp amino terminal domain, pathogenicity island component
MPGVDAGSRSAHHGATGFGGLRMFERFTDRARRVVVLAQEEARLLDHNYIGTEHLLLGMIHEGEGVAAEALERLGVSLVAVRAEVERVIGRGKETPAAHIPFTPRAKKVLELSLREALNFGHNYIGTEHILLGLIREGEGVAAQVLTQLGADLDRVRQQVNQILYIRGAEQSGALGAGKGGPPYGARHARQQSPGPVRLVRVVPIAREVEISEGRRLALLSLEVWSEWVDLRVSLSSSEEEPRPPQGTAGYDAWTLADDLGTEYRRLGTSFGGDDLFQVHESTFAPSPPPEASTLTLTLPAAEDRDEIQVVVELR